MHRVNTYCPFFVLVVLFIGLNSCKKDKLKNEKEILIGKWTWTHTYYEYNKCTQCCHLYDTLSTLVTNKTFAMEFEKKGKVKFYENDVLVDTYRIIFDDFYGESDFVYDIHLDGDENQRLLGRVYTNGTLYSWDYPYKAVDSPCDDYKNYFIKE